MKETPRTLPKKLQIVWLLWATFIGAVSCGHNNTNGTSQNTAKAFDIKRGEALFASNCMTCHQTQAQDASVAPHAAIVKEVYAKKHNTLEAFVQAVSAFAAMPDASTSLMPDAIRKYGIMAGLPLPEADLQDIAAYWHQAPMAQPEPQPDTTTPQGKGLSMALRTKAILGKNLTQAIQKKGTEAAVAFCNTRALPLTDSMSHALQSNIKRVSDKPRNPANQATPEELRQIEKFKKIMASGQRQEPVYAPTRTHHVVYYPITTMPMCLQCHGKKDIDIVPAVDKIITSKYPTDMATGYDLNEVRGMWVVKWLKSKQ